jgi:ABC-2 type transport system ATP-binding protein
VANRDETAKAAQVLAGLGAGQHVADPQSGLVRVQAGNEGTHVVFEAVRRLDDAAIWVADIALHKPTLDDVFLTLTGHAAEQAPTEDEPAAGAKAPRRGRKGRQ